MGNTGVKSGWVFESSYMHYWFCHVRSWNSNSLTGHLLIILDNSTTAMTGHQEHPGTGRDLLHEPAHKVSFEELAKAMGLKRIFTVDPRPGNPEVRRIITESLASNELTLIVARRPCILIAPQIREWEKCLVACEKAEA